MSESRRTRRLLAVAACGGVLGLGVETTGLACGVWVPAGGGTFHPWIVGVYFVCLVLAGLFFQAVERRLAPSPRVSRRRLLVEAVLFGLLVASPVALHQRELALLAAASAYLAGRLLLFRERRDLLVAAFVAAVDLAVEGGLVAGSVYHYPGAAHLPLPLWLAPLWGGLALSLRRLFIAAGVSGRAGAGPAG